MSKTFIITAIMFSMESRFVNSFEIFFDMHCSKTDSGVTWLRTYLCVF